ncbi:MAG: glycosyltransferase family 39 protein [Anaerolineae bacterium]
MQGSGAVASARNHQELARTCFAPALLLLAFALRALRLDFQPLWWDEGYSLYAATMSIPAMLARTAEDIHPPFYYALLHLWIGLCGASPAAVRMFSVAAGLLGLALLYAVGRRLVGRNAALLALFIAALAPFHVYYSQEARMYGLAMALGLLSVYLMWRWLEDSPHTGAWHFGSARHLSQPPLAGYVLVTAMALYTHYYAVFIPIFQSAFVLYKIYHRGRRERSGSSFLQWLAGQAAIFTIYLPWVIYTASKLSAYVQGKVEIEKYSSLPFHIYLAWHLAAFSAGHLSEGISSLGWAALLFAGLAVVGGLTRWKVPGTSSTSFLVLYLLGPLFLGYLVNLCFPFAPARVERLLLFAAPAWYLLAALGMAWLWQKVRGIFGSAVHFVLLAFILLVSGISLHDFYTVPRYPDDDYRPLIAQVRAWARPEDAVLCLYPWQIGYFKSYLHGSTPALYPAFEMDWEARREDATLLPRYLDGLMARHGRLWFPAHQSAGRLLETEIEEHLATHYYPVLGDWLNPHTRLFFYVAGERREAGPEHVNFADRLSLVGSEFSPGPLEAGRDVAEVSLLWRKEGQMEGVYRVGLRLKDEAGKVWAQRDGEPLAGLRPFSSWGDGEEARDRHGLFIPAGTPPGRYELCLVVYRASDGRMLDVLDANRIPEGVEVALGSVDVIFPTSHPPPEALPIQHPLAVDLSDEKFSIRLLGWSLPEVPFKPGDEIQLNLFWQTLQEIEEDYVSFVQLQDELGRLLANEEGPVPHWEGGQFIREIHRLLIPGGAPSGKHHLICGLYRLRDGARLKAKDGRDYVLLAPVEIAAGREPDYQKPSVPHPLYARFGDGAALLGYDMDAKEARPGETLRLTLYWHALAPMDKSYTVFVHLLDAGERIQGQIDTIPGLGTLPTTAWLPGEYIKDECNFTVKEGAAPGLHRIEIGLYDARTGARLSVKDGNGKLLGDRLLLDTPIEIIP